jgi:hypothetical protein
MQARINQEGDLCRITGVAVCNWTLAQSSCPCGRVSVIHITNRDCFRLQRMPVWGWSTDSAGNSCHAGTSRPCGLTKEMQTILSELQTPVEGAHADLGGAPLDLAAAAKTQKQPGSSITRSCVCHVPELSCFSGDAVEQQWEATLHLL